jgi:hypothetical protein
MANAVWYVVLDYGNRGAMSCDVVSCAVFDGRKTKKCDFLIRYTLCVQERVLLL